MDPKTVIKDHSCSCGKNRSNCIHSVIERPGDLIAQRFEAEGDHQELNLASLGLHQKPKHPASAKRMKYIQIEFRTHDERNRFETRFRDTQRIYQTIHSFYWADLRIEEQNHGVSFFSFSSYLMSMCNPLGWNRP